LQAGRHRRDTMILELHRQGLKVAAIARQLGVDRKTVRK
jgi:DNA-binding NarL/FixJ family response regulator